jgi:hypothetical protein
VSVRLRRRTRRKLEQRLAESLEQQTATAEILRVISSTHTDLGPVFDTIVRNAGRVCDAVDAAIVLVDGAETVRAAHWGPIAGLPLGNRLPLTRGTVMGRAILDAGAITSTTSPPRPTFHKVKSLGADSATARPWRFRFCGNRVRSGRS